MPKIDPEAAGTPQRSGSRYPDPYAEPCRARSSRRLGLAGGLTDFGVNLVTVPPGAWSSQRHAHFDDDEFLMMVEGELELVEHDGRTTMRAGDCAAFPKGGEGGHHLVNESNAPARFLVVGANKGGATYPDIDLLYRPGDPGYRRKDGSFYPPEAYSF